MAQWKCPQVTCRGEGQRAAVLGLPSWYLQLPLGPSVALWAGDHQDVGLGLPVPVMGRGSCGTISLVRVRERMSSEQQDSPSLLAPGGNFLSMVSGSLVSKPSGQ